MGLFRRKTSGPAATTPVVRGSCSCPELDEALLQRPGVEVVDWEDREVLHVGAPTLCVDGVLAAAARALLDPRVKQ